MHTVSHRQVIPLASAHGETIYELIGRGTSTPAQAHSLALVTLPPGTASLLLPLVRNHAGVAAPQIVPGAEECHNCGSRGGTA